MSKLIAKGVTEVGTSAVDVVTIGSSITGEVKSCFITNVTGSNVTISLSVFRDPDTFNILKDIIVPAGSTIEVISGSSIYLQSLDVLRLVSSAPASVDCYCSIVYYN